MFLGPGPVAPLLLITIQHPSSDQSSHYIVSSPRARLAIPEGRWTRTSIAYDAQKNKRVTLKDSWRMLLDDIPPEGVVYAKLHENSVPNVPHCSLAVDVGNEKYHKSQTDSSPASM